MSEADAYRLYRQGLDALAAGHADEAIAPLERAKRLEPESNSVHEALGKTYLQLGFFDRAAAEFEVILERDPVDAYAHYCMGRALDRQGDYRGARHHYRLATFFEPDRKIYRDTLNAFVARAYAAELDGAADGDGSSSASGTDEFPFRVFGE